MVKRVIMVHGWGGNPRNWWFPAVRSALAAKGFMVVAPSMPDTARPKIRPWVTMLKKTVGTVDDETYFIGHSIGCQTIIRYLASQKNRCGGCVFVAGWFVLTGLTTADERRIAAPWQVRPIDFAAAKRNMRSSVAILSDDDPYVPARNQTVFRKVLGTRVIVQKEKDHFDNNKHKELPTVVTELLRMAK